MRNLELWDIDKIFVKTYGTPRVGDAMFAAKLSQSVYQTFRLLYLKDPVAYTIWYNVATPAIAMYLNQKCENPEDPKCDDNGNNPAQHYAYFGYKQKDYDSYTC
ncbi:hypothetical protein WR25_14440 [Diploscapter pachys]|uniref:Fungal lipase-type domain-containing protein n=1 Tax=Diploscapter pachys TaxID=2018661 RepID=A0A2A2JGD0_9BILA|nr:hypothetical protein WR25_14440 [Diploscapter pachys]